MNLFIIGNGFDKAHGLPTSYIDFRNYLKNVDWEYLFKLEAPYGYLPESKQELVENDLWKEFENNLFLINEFEIIDRCTSLDMGLEGEEMGIEDTLNMYWEEEYGYIEKLNDYVKAWAESININTVKKRKWANKYSNAFFISFNYTQLLEQTYKIDPCRILHLHGSINVKRDLCPVIGHGNFSKIIETRRKSNEASEKFLEKETSIYNALANYYERTLKDVYSYIKMYDSFFTNLKLVDHVYVIGHSFSDIDLPYFKKIFESIQKDAKWDIYYYTKEEKDNFTEKIKAVGVNSKNFQLHDSSLFFDD